MQKTIYRLFVFLLLGVAALAPAQEETAPAEEAAAVEPEVRMLWVTRWDYTKPEHVTAIMENAAKANFNVVLFQVRGNGTAFYDSDIEPWAWELTGTDASTTGKDPGWDPLALAVKEAHARGLEIHAYINVFPAWRSQDFPPRDSGQLWWEHPDWFMADAAGERMIPRDHRFGEKRPDWYSFISPGVPEVQDYIASIVEEIATKYEVDGIHFDYIRYPAEIREVEPEFRERADKLGNWSYDARSLARFWLETGGKQPDDAPEAWTDWRADQVTQTLRKSHERASAARDGLIFTAAVFADPTDARQTKYQDYIRWLNEGLLDYVTPMNYANEVQRFRERSEHMAQAVPDPKQVVMGFGAGYGENITVEEIQVVRDLPFSGFAAFAYTYLFDRDNNHQIKPTGESVIAGPLAAPAPLPWNGE